MNVNELKKLSGTEKFVSFFGKSTIQKESLEYKMIVSATKVVIEQGFGVIHGGYAGGAMEAVSDTASEILLENNCSEYRNIGVPQVQHDLLWKRVEKAQFANSCNNIFERLQEITQSDLVIVCPLGGDGTDLEQTLVLSENLVKAEMNKHSKVKEKITPMIFLETENGTQWKTLLEYKLKILDTSKSLSDIPWCFFVSSVADFERVLERFLNKKIKED
jgi:predicted Rossmann-fold nucleotide-binding protein